MKAVKLCLHERISTLSFSIYTSTKVDSQIGEFFFKLDEKRVFERDNET